MKRSTPHDRQNSMFRLAGGIFIHVDFFCDFHSGTRAFGIAGYDFGWSKIGVLLEHLFDAYLLAFGGKKGYFSA